MKKIFVTDISLKNAAADKAFKLSFRDKTNIAKILDTILHLSVSMVDDLPKWVVILFIYLVVLLVLTEWHLIIVKTLLL